MKRLIATVLLATVSLHAEELFVLTASSKVFRFPIDDGTSQQPNLVQITGLQPSESIVGIDFRPATGQLFGVGSTSRLYLIDTVTGAATAAGANPFNTLLSGVRFGVDFNPTVDRLRIVSDTGQSLRVVPDSGALNSDATLAYATLDPAFGIAPHVVSAAYANNLSIATSTTLYAIDSTQDTLVTIGSVNGTVNPNLGQVFTVGKLGIDASDLVGFDISGQSGRAYMLNTNALNETKIYTVNLATGNAILAGPLFIAGETIIDLAVAPAPTTFDMVVLRANGQISRIDTRLPALATPAVGVTGLQNGETIREIDYRPATGELTGLGTSGRIYTINPFTGAATQLFTDPVNPLPAFDMGIGFDFNPAVEALRIVTNAGGNARFLSSGLYTVDPNLAYATGDTHVNDTPSVVAVAYSNNVANSTATTIYYIDQVLGILATSDNPNGGQLNTIGSLGLGSNIGANVGFDIASSGTAFLSVNNNLYTINLSTGGATSITSIGGGAVRGIATVVQSAVPRLEFVAPNFSAVEGDQIRLVVQRFGSAKGAISVDFGTQDGTATAPVNYTRASGTLTLLDGQTFLEFDIPTKNDNVFSLPRTATITLSNPIGVTLGTLNTATLTIFDLNDLDGDGFSNDVELAFGTEQFNPVNTPFAGAPPGTPQLLTISKATVKLNFAKPTGSDSISFSGTIPNIAAIPVGKAGVEIGSVLGKPGVVQVVTLDAKGKSTPKGLTIGAQKNGISKVSFSVSKGTFAAALAAAGLTNTNATKAPLTLNFNLYFNNIVYATTVNMLYTAKQGKSGSATKAK